MTTKEAWLALSNSKMVDAVGSYKHLSMGRLQWHWVGFKDRATGEIVATLANDHPKHRLCVTGMEDYRCQFPHLGDVNDDIDVLAAWEFRHRNELPSETPKATGAVDRILAT